MKTQDAIRALLIAMGTFGVAKGWWGQEGLETVVDQIIVFGGASLAIGAFAWGVWAKLHTKEVPIDSKGKAK